MTDLEYSVLAALVKAYGKAVILELVDGIETDLAREAAEET